MFQSTTLLNWFLLLNPVTKLVAISPKNPSQDTAELFFEDVRLPKSALLGEENKGFYYLMNELPQERLIIGMMAIGSCEYMFEETRNYVRERKAFGKTLSKLQVWDMITSRQCPLHNEEKVI